MFQWVRKAYRLIGSATGMSDTEEMIRESQRLRVELDLKVTRLQSFTHTLEDAVAARTDTNDDKR